MMKIITYFSYYFLCFSFSSFNSKYLKLIGYIGLCIWTGEALVESRLWVLRFLPLYSGSNQRPFDSTRALIKTIFLWNIGQQNHLLELDQYLGIGWPTASLDDSLTHGDTVEHLCPVLVVHVFLVGLGAARLVQADVVDEQVWRLDHPVYRKGKTEESKVRIWFRTRDDTGTIPNFLNFTVAALTHW